MADLVLVDADVILKLFAYKAADFLVCDMEGAPAAMLSLARFVIRKRSADYVGETDEPEYLQALERLLAALMHIEPTSEEIDFAAELEEAAIRAGLDLDVGEAQLLAVMVRRQADLLLTGDKRAVIAIHRCLLEPVKHRIVCLEQIITAILETVHHDDLRQRVCAKPNVDKALTACFSCSSPKVASEEILQGLGSYSSDLRRKSGDCLIESNSMGIQI